MNTFDRETIPSSESVVSRNLAGRFEQDPALIADPRTGRVYTSRKLCADLGCSSATLCAAFRLLAERHLIVKAPIGGNRWVLSSHQGVASREMPRPEPRIARPAAIAEELRRRIICRRLPQGRLPSGKLLCREFGCHHSTLREAIALLAGQGLLEEFGGSYRVAMHASDRSGSASIWLLESTQSFAELTQWERAAIAGIEQSLSELGWGQLRLLVRDISVRSDIQVDHQVAGFINLYREGRRSWWTQLEKAAARNGIPSVLVDISDMVRLEIHRKANNRIHWVKADNFGAGRSVGAYLQGKGHRRVAYLSTYPFRAIESYPHHRDLRNPWSASLWAQKRYLGLLESFGALGAESVDSFDAVDNRGLVRLLQGYPNLLPESFCTLRESLALNPWLDKPEIDEKFGSMQRLLEFAEDGAMLEPWFENILSCSPATAWVCSNDDLAFLALRFLAKKRKAVPKGIAVVGFDNTLDASRLGLTSFDLGMREIGALAVNLIATPRLVRVDKENTAYVSGRLIPRETA